MFSSPLWAKKEPHVIHHACVAREFGRDILRRVSAKQIGIYSVVYMVAVSTYLLAMQRFLPCKNYPIPLLHVHVHVYYTSLLYHK